MAEPQDQAAQDPANADALDEEAALADGRFIKVSAASRPKAVAGKIAHMCRAGEPPATMCIGAASINQAVKSICIARQYLTNDGMDLSFQPAFREPDRRASVALYIAKSIPGAVKTEGADIAELSVAGHSKPAVLAGALAARVRENKQPVLTAIGVDAVSNAVLAIGNARLFLEQNNVDVRALPEFVTVKKEERELNAETKTPVQLYDGVICYCKSAAVSTMRGDFQKWFQVKFVIKVENV